MLYVVTNSELVVPMLYVVTKSELELFLCCI